MRDITLLDTLTAVSEARAGVDLGSAQITRACSQNYVILLSKS